MSLVFNEEALLLIMQGPCALIILIIIISYIYKWAIRRAAKRINKFYLWTTLLVMILYLSCSMVDIYHAYASYKNNHPMKDPSWDTIKFVADFLYFIGCTILYINIVGRLYLTFATTIYHLQIPILVVICCLITLSFCVMMMYCYIIAVLDDNKYFKWSAMCDLSLMIIDIILNTTILGLFVFKLRQLIINITINDLATSTSNYKELVSTADDTDSISSTLLYDEYALKRKDRLITVVTRHTILSCIAIICNQCFYSVNTVYYLYAPNETWTAISYAGREIEGVIISLVLYLNFNFNMRIYKKLCNSCHMCCYNCFKKSTKIDVKIMRQHASVNDDDAVKGIFMSVQKNEYAVDNPTVNANNGNVI